MAAAFIFLYFIKKCSFTNPLHGAFPYFPLTSTFFIQKQNLAALKEETELSECRYDAYFCSYVIMAYDKNRQRR